MEKFKNSNLYFYIGIMLLTLTNWMHGTGKLNDTVFTVCMVVVIVVELVGLSLYVKNKKSDSKEA